MNTKKYIFFYFFITFLINDFSLIAGCTWTTTASAASLGWNNPLSWSKSGSCSGDWPFSSPLGNGDVVNINHSVTYNGNIVIPNNATFNINSGTLTINGNVDLQNGSTFLSSEGTTMVVNGNFNNSNNSVGVTVDGNIIVSGNLTSGNGSTVTSSSGTGSFNVEGSISGSGTVFGSSADCPDTGNPCLTSSSNPLPIELIRFYAECSDNEISIKWSTASEYNNDYFKIARSNDGINWIFLPTVKGAGNSTSTIDYEIKDLDRSINNSYYRLSQVDFDGSTTTFDIIKASCFNDFLINSLSSSPNPSSNLINLSLSNLSFFGDSKIIIFSSTGMEVYNKGINIIKNDFIYQINDLNLDSGIYYIKVSNGLNSTNIVKHLIK